MELLRRRPALIIVILTVLIGAMGTALTDGIDFMVTPLPVPKLMAGLGMSTNGILALVAMVMVYRNLHRYEERWTWQEAAFARGTFLIVFAGVLGYLARAFTDPSVTLGTPVYTIGILFLIYASVRPPERFGEDEDLTLAEYHKAQAALDDRFRDVLKNRRSQ